MLARRARAARAGGGADRRARRRRRRPRRRRLSSARSQHAVETFGGLDIVVPNSGGPPPARPSEIDADAGRRRPSSCCCSPSSASSGWRCRTCCASDQGRIVLVSSIAVREPVPQPRADERRASGRRRLPEVARHRARPAGGDRQLRSRPAASRPRACASSTATGRRRTSSRRSPLGRLGEPRELGDLVAFLCSSRAVLHHRHADPGRRRPVRARSCDAPRHLAGGLLLAGLALLLVAASCSGSARPTSTSSSRTWRTRSRRS